MWKTSSDDCSNEPTGFPPAFDLTSALELLPTNRLLNRLAPKVPSIAISADVFLQLQAFLPIQEQRSKWVQLFSTDENGYSPLSLANNCRDAACGEKCSAVLLVKTPSCTIGAFLSVWPDWHQKKYYGTNGTFVFVVQESSSGKLEVHNSNSSDAGSNNYYLKTTSTELMCVGGGGTGPAIQLCDDLQRIRCSARCPTFGLDASLLTPGQVDVVTEAGTSESCVLAVELWAFSKNTFCR